MEERIALGGGCFWCTEAVFRRLKGVTSVESGYTGGNVVDPSYEQVCSGTTGHVEVTLLTYEPDTISLEEILRIFFVSHDPTTIDRQGNDIGPQYRSAIFYTRERQREKARHYIDTLNKGLHERPIVTTVEELQVFYPADDRHKEYYEKNKEAPYCRLIIAPKVEHLEKRFPALLKPETLPRE